MANWWPWSPGTNGNGAGTNGADKPPIPQPPLPRQWNDETLHFRRTGFIGALSRLLTWGGKNPPSPDVTPKRYPGPTAARDTEWDTETQRQRMASGPRGVVMPAFLPYFDDRTGETSGMRQEYRRMLANPVIKPSLFGKILNVAALDLQVHPPKSKGVNRQSTGRDRNIADFMSWNLNERLKGGVPELIWNVLLGGCIDGYSINQPVWQPTSKGKYAGKVACAKASPIVVDDDAVLQLDPFRDTVSVLGLRYNGGLEFDPSTLMIYSHMPLYGLPTGMSDMRAAYASYWMWDAVYKMRVTLVNGRAFPIVWGQYQRDDREAKKTLEAMLSKLRQQSWASVPESVQLKVLEAAGSAENVFASFRKDLQEDIALSITGATLQMLVGDKGAQRGNSQVHQETSTLFPWYMARCVECLLNDYDSGLIVNAVDLNYVVGEYPRATLSSVDLDKVKAELELIEKAHGMGVDFRLSSLYELLGQEPPDPDDPEDTLKGTKTPPPGGAPGSPAAQPNPSAPQKLSPQTFAEDGFYHGPESPGEGWVLAGTGPHGGKMWKRSSADEAVDKGNSGSGPAKEDIDPDDPIHGYIDAFQNPDPGDVITAEDANGANRELENDDSEYRMIIDDAGKWRPEHIDTIKDEYGDDWIIQKNPLTGKVETGDQGYFNGLDGGDEISQSYLEAWNDPDVIKPPKTQKDLDDLQGEIDQVNQEMEDDGSDFRMAFNWELKKFVAVPVEDNEEYREMVKRFCERHREGRRHRHRIVILKFAEDGCYGPFSETRWSEANALHKFAVARQQRRIGEVWQGPSGRYFTRNAAGRTVPAKNPQGAKPGEKPAAKTPVKSPPRMSAAARTTKPPARPKATPAETLKAIGELKTSGKHTPEAVTALLQGHTVLELKEIARALKVPVGGTKATVTGRIASPTDRAVRLAKEVEFKLELAKKKLAELKGAPKKKGPSGRKVPSGNPHVPDLAEETHAIIGGVKKNAAANETNAVDVVAKHFKKSPEEVKKSLKKAWDEAEVTMNFMPHRPLPGKGPHKTTADSLIAESNLKNLFETGTGGGSTDNYQRHKWEEANFGPSVGDIGNKERPKYAAVNFGNEPDGAASLYGRGVFVLNKEVLKDRMTLAPSNTSVTDSNMVGTANDPLNALARNENALKHAGLWSGNYGSDKTGKNHSPPKDTERGYTEAQIFGELPINSTTIKEVRLPKHAEYTTKEEDAANKKLEAHFKKLGIKVRRY